MKAAVRSSLISAVLMAAAAGLVPEPATAQDFARPAVAPPPLPKSDSSADLTRNYRMVQARQAAARGAVLPKGIVPDGSGNLVVLGRVNGNVVMTPPTPGKAR